MDTTEFERWYTTRFRRQNGRNPSPITVQQKGQRVRYCARLAGEFSVTLDTVLTSRTKWEQFADALDARMTTGTQRKTVYDVRDYAEFLVSTGAIEAHVLLPSDVPPANPAPQIVTYTPEEMERFKTLSWAGGVRWGCFINYLAETGRRVGETLALEWRWFRLDDDPPYIELPAEVTKARKPQYVVLTRLLREEVFTPDTIAELKQERGQMSADTPIGELVFPWRYNTAHARFDRFCRKVKLPNRGFHNFRHTVITQRIASGMPIQAVSAHAGHDNVMTTVTRYAHATALDYGRYLD